MTPKRPPVSSFTSRDQRRGAEVIRKQLDATDPEQDPTLREELTRVAELLDGKRRGAQIPSRPMGVSTQIGPA